MPRGMKLTLVLALVVGTSVADDDRVLESRQDKLSYALGMEAGGNLRRHGLEVDTEWVLQGLEDALAGGEVLLSEKEARALLAELRSALAATADGVDASTELAEKNRKEGEAFLTQNSTRAGVVVLDSGLQYSVLKAGDGASPRIGDIVITHYRGTLVDGTEFDSSFARGQPATLRVNGVIKGWSEALQLMSVGSKWRIFLPPELAYGSRGTGGMIGPNSTLIFELELLGIGAMPAGAANSAGSPQLSGLRFAYRLDPRLTRGLYMGDRWVSSPTYKGIVGQDTVRARAEGLDAQGRPIAVQPKWTPADSSMVTVTPSVGSEVDITVKRAGRSNLQVTFGAVTTELVIHAEKEGESLKLEIARRS